MLSCPIGCLDMFFVDSPVSFLVYPDRICQTIFFCTVVHVRVVFLNRRLNYLIHLVDRTYIRESIRDCFDSRITFADFLL